MSKEINKMENFDFNNIAVLNGTVGLSDTEGAFFKRLTDDGFAPLMLDDLFNHPERLILLKTNGIKTIVAGTLNNATLTPVFEAFNKLNWLPENALITRGEEFFNDFSSKVNMFVLLPMHFSSDEIEILAFEEWL